jgi:endonuclease/exonuclease/phosphatase family metal-dependent hydrolase
MKLRVATFNLENLDDKPKGIPLDARIAVLRPQLLALDADVLCLQECSAGVKDQGVRELRALDRLVDGTPYADFARATTKGASGGPSDKHNLVVLSRLPISAHEQHWHDFVAPPVVRLTTTPAPRDEEVRWDRPVLEVRLQCPDGRPLFVFDAHLRAPLAAPIEGQKLAPLSWRTTEGWAEGYFVAAMKRAGQALELRQRIDRILDADPDARVLVAGDLNAGVAGTAYRILRADVENTGNPALAGRSLVALEDRIPEARRYTVIHRGRRQVLDHLLASRALAAGHVGTDVLNDGLEDEYEIGVQHVEPVGSLHAPLVAEVEL